MQCRYLFTKNFALLQFMQINATISAILFSATMLGRFCLNFVFWFGYTSKEHMCLNGRIYGNSPRQMSKDCKHLGGGGEVIRDKVKINLLLRPLLGVF